MGKIKIPYFIEIRNKRTEGVRYYWQPSSELREGGWRNERLPDSLSAAVDRAKELNSQVAAWRSGLGEANGGGGKAVRPGSIKALVQRYKKSRFYEKLKPGTKPGYDWALKHIQIELGEEEPVAAITPKVVERLYTRVCKRSVSSANSIIRVLQALMKFAVKDGAISTNPAAKPGLINTAAQGVLWPEAAVDLLVATADEEGRPSVGDAIELAYWLAQRPTDVLRLDRRVYRNGQFRIAQSKTNARLQIPHSPRLQRRLDAALERLSQRNDVVATTLVVSEETGRPYQDTNFSHVFATIRAAAAKKTPVIETEDGTQVHVESLVFRQLRHTGVTRLAEAGCEIPEIAAISGHTMKSVHNILERYMVRTSKLAQNAAQKRLLAEQEGTGEETKL